MIDLNIQIKLIIFSFIFGFFFSFTMEAFNKKIKKYKNYIKLSISFLLILSFTYIYFIGIQNIGYGIFHIYSILSIVVGFLFYDLIIVLIAKKNKK